MADLHSIQGAVRAAPDAGPLGRVHAVSGSKASIGLIGSDGLQRSGATVGKFVKIRTGHALLVGYRFQHFSNGNQFGSNPGVNSHVLVVGWSHRRYLS